MYFNIDHTSEFYNMIPSDYVFLTASQLPASLRFELTIKPLSMVKQWEQPYMPGKAFSNINIRK